MTVPLDQSQALWQIHLIDGYGPGCAMFFRMHHCMADGIAMATAWSEDGISSVVTGDR